MIYLCIVMNISENIFSLLWNIELPGTRHGWCFEGNKYFSFTFQAFFCIPLIWLWFTYYSAWMTSHCLLSLPSNKKWSCTNFNVFRLCHFIGWTCLSLLFTDTPAYKVSWVSECVCNFACMMYNSYMELLISTFLNIWNIKGNIRFDIFLKFKEFKDFKGIFLHYTL